MLGSRPSHIPRSTDVRSVVKEIAAREPLITPHRQQQLSDLIDSLPASSCGTCSWRRRADRQDAAARQQALLPVEGVHGGASTSLTFRQSIRAHVLPLTNVALNKAGTKCVRARGPVAHAGRFITGSYDRACKVWDSTSGEELHTLDGHKNVVYAIAFNNPFGFVAVAAAAARHVAQRQDRHGLV